MADMDAPALLRQDIGDAFLSYLSYEGEGRTVILLHATGFQPWLWHPIARALAPEFRILAPYFCDHRETDPEQGGIRWLTLAGDLASFCRRLEIDRPLMVGHSMGGTVITMAAASHGLSPRGMVLVEPIFLPREFYRMRIGVEEHPLASRAIRRTNHWQDGEDALAYLRSKSLFRDWDEEMLRLYVGHGMQASPEGGLELVCTPRREAGLFIGGVHDDPWPLMPRVACPVLVLQGERSDAAEYVDFRKVSSLFPRASLQVVPRAGHLVPMEKPAEMVRILRDFFRSLAKKD